MEGQTNSLFGKRRANLCWQPEGRTPVVTALLTKDGDSAELCDKLWAVSHGQKQLQVSLTDIWGKNKLLSCLSHYIFGGLVLQQLTLHEQKPIPGYWSTIPPPHTHTPTLSHCIAHTCSYFRPGLTCIERLFLSPLSQSNLSSFVILFSWTPYSFLPSYSSG